MTIYLPNPTKHLNGLADVKIGDLIMVKTDDWKRYKRYVVNSIGTHGNNNKVWNMGITPENEYFKNTGKYGILQENRK